MPRKRKHSSEEEDEEPEDVESNVRTKRRAAVEARDRVAAKEGASDEEEEEEEDLEEEDDDKDEDYEGEGAGDEEGDEEGDEDDEEEDENEGAAAAEGDEDEEDDEEVEDEEQEPDTVECIPADLEEPTKGELLIYLHLQAFPSDKSRYFLFLLSKALLQLIRDQTACPAARDRTRTQGEILEFELHVFSSFNFHLRQTQLVEKQCAKLRFLLNFTLFSLYVLEYLLSSKA